MGFWESIGIAEPEDDGRDDAGGNLPTAKVIAGFGICDECGIVSELGNRLCVDCWDEAVDSASANNSNWPNAWTYDFNPN
jgi:hypothetical protein